MGIFGKRGLWIGLIVLVGSILACTLSQQTDANTDQHPAPNVEQLQAGNSEQNESADFYTLGPPDTTSTVTPIVFNVDTPIPSATPLPSLTPLPISTTFVEAAGCMRPPDDYTRVTIGNATVNQRTYWMLERAQTLYGGTIPLTGAGITQGSYNPGGVAASFGTHDGGGVVDLTVRNIPYDFSIKWDDIPKLIDSLRLAGFAAYYRDERENLVPHIHAVAIGDRDLSPAAAEQLTGRYGYFRGYDGFPRDNDVPLTPRYGTVVICQWMLDMGYRDLRGEPLPLE